MTTADGYILKMFRIRPKEVNDEKKHPPIILQHGLISSAETWVVNGELSWPVKLLEAGYDVWLGNSRGNIYSRGHVSISTEDDAYFNFSFYEMGKFDLPAMLDYVRGRTGFEKVAYMGHSQGTTQMFSAIAENQGSIRDKISMFIALAPVVQLRNTKD